MCVDIEHAIWPVVFVVLFITTTSLSLICTYNTVLANALEIQYPGIYLARQLQLGNFAKSETRRCIRELRGKLFSLSPFSVSLCLSSSLARHFRAENLLYMGQLFAHFIDACIGVTRTLVFRFLFSLLRGFISFRCSTFHSLIFGRGKSCVSARVTWKIASTSSGRCWCCEGKCFGLKQVFWVSRWWEGLLGGFK